MNKFYIYLLSIFFILFLGIQFWDINTPPNDSEYHEIGMLAIETDYSNNDFSKLDSILGDKKIIMLGESMHSDGSTFIMKSKLIKYLHKKFGYDVVLFEAGLYDMARLNNAESKIKPTNFLYPFWGDVEETNDLWSYFDKHKSISLGGFDIQYTGNLSDSLRGVALRDYLKKCGININEYSSFIEVIDKLSQYTSLKYKYSLSNTKKDSILTDMDNIHQKLLLSKNDTIDNYLYSTYLRNSRDWYHCVWHNDHMSKRRFHIRDSLMAENLIYQIENNYKNRKIIVWAANLHIIHDNNGYKDKIPFASMGEYIKNKYSDSCYTLAFSSYCNDNEHGEIYNKASNKSIEYLLHKLGYKSAFVDFQKMMDKHIIIRANQNMNLKGKWREMIDGLFFIDTMKKIKPNDETNNWNQKFIL